MCVKLTPIIYCTLNAWIRQPLYMILKTTAVNATPKHCRSFLFMFIHSCSVLDCFHPPETSASVRSGLLNFKHLTYQKRLVLQLHVISLTLKWDCMYLQSSCKTAIKTPQSSLAMHHRDKIGLHMINYCCCLVLNIELTGNKTLQDSTHNKILTISSMRSCTSQMPF